MSIWLFDLGNTRLKCAPLRSDGSIGEVLSIAHGGVHAHGMHGMHAESRFGALLAPALPARIDVAHVASVAAPGLHAALMDALAARGARITEVATQKTFGAVEIAYAQPQRLGVDRFLALLGARARDPAAALIVGVGTALTVDLLDGAGRHRGGRIAPSPALMRASLHARAAQLPEHGGSYREFAADTDDALASGCDGAAIALVQRSLEQAQDLLGCAPRLLLHGGGAQTLCPQLPMAVPVPMLVLEGLAAWARAGDPQMSTPRVLTPRADRP